MLVDVMNDTTATHQARVAAARTVLEETRRTPELEEPGRARVARCRLGHWGARAKIGESPEAGTVRPPKLEA